MQSRFNYLFTQFNRMICSCFVFFKVNKILVQHNRLVLKPVNGLSFLLGESHWFAAMHGCGIIRYLTYISHISQYLLTEMFQTVLEGRVGSGQYVVFLYPLLCLQFSFK